MRYNKLNSLSVHTNMETNFTKDVPFETDVIFAPKNNLFLSGGVSLGSALSLVVTMLLGVPIDANQGK